MAADILQIGEREVWGQTYPFGVSPADRARHVYLIGQTGTGKSTLIKNMIAQDLAAGEGLALIDPHGDLVDDILPLVPRHRIGDVIVLDPSDREHVVGVNPFYRVAEADRALVAANLVAAFRHVWADSWGPRLEYILFNTVAALVEAPDACRPSFLGIARLLVDDAYRARVVASVSDARVRSFFQDEFERWPARQLAEALSPVQNKIGQVLSAPLVRNVLAQWRPSFDVDQVLSRRQVLLVRVPKGRMGADPANLLGSLLVTSLLQAAMRRDSGAGRVPFHLYIDEFQNFTTDAFASILSEARKYALTLTIGHQYFEQLKPSVRAAVLGNVGSLVSFRVGAEDAVSLAQEFGEIAPGLLCDLRRGEVVAKLTRATTVAQPFRGRTVDDAPVYGFQRRVLDQSRRRYARSRAEVEGKISHWLSN